MRIPECCLECSVGSLMRVDRRVLSWQQLFWGRFKKPCHNVSVCWCKVGCRLGWKCVVGISRALIKEYISKGWGHGLPLRSSALYTYTPALLASLSSKQKYVRTKTQTWKRLGGVPSKLKISVKRARFQSDVLVPGPSRDVSDEVEVEPRACRMFRLETSEKEQGDWQRLYWLYISRDLDCIDQDGKLIWNI